MESNSQRQWLQDFGQLNSRLSAVVAGDWPVITGCMRRKGWYRLAASNQPSTRSRASSHLPWTVEGRSHSYRASQRERLWSGWPSTPTRQIDFMQLWGNAIYPSPSRNSGLANFITRFPACLCICTTWLWFCWVITRYNELFFVIQPFKHETTSCVAATEMGRIRPSLMSACLCFREPLRAKTIPQRPNLPKKQG